MRKEENLKLSLSRNCVLIILNNHMESERLSPSLIMEGRRHGVCVCVCVDGEVLVWTI